MPMPSYDELELFARANLHYIILALTLAYVVLTKAKTVTADVLKTAKDNSARAAVRKESKALPMTQEQRIQAAREKQFQRTQAAAERDIELAAEADRVRLEEQRAKLAMRISGGDGQLGRRLGHGDPEAAKEQRQLNAQAAPADAPEASAAQAAPPASSGNAAAAAAEEEGPRLKLPKLPGGERESYAPYAGSGDDRGYRPSRFGRNCGPKGG